jgi:protein-L-isoaspartate(D-aspartate) O-methyltransferase
VRIVDGTLGWAESAPFDAIVVTAGGFALPPAYQRQLAEGGRVVIPLGEVLTSQRMMRFTRRGPELAEEDLGGFAFVPLIGQDGWSSASAMPDD